MSALVNSARGESILRINGCDQRLCLTLGALAELEGAFDCAGFGELGARLAQMNASDLLIVLAALCAGGGGARSAAELAAAQFEPRAAAAAVAAAFRQALDE